MQTSKNSCSRETFEIDWTNFYTEFGLDTATDLITLSTWTVTSGALGPEFTATPITKAFIEGGVVGETIVAENVIEINNGEYKDCFKLFIKVT